MLLVRAMSHIPKAAALLEDWSAVLRFAYGKWRDDPTAKLTRADALQVLDGDPQRTRFATLLFLRERWPFGSGHGGPDDEWSQEIISAVRDVRDTKGPADIIAARDKTELPPLNPPLEPDPPSQEVPSPSPLKRAWRTVSENTLIATVVGGIVVLVVSAYVFHSTTGEAPTAAVAKPSPAGRRPGARRGRLWLTRAGSRREQVVPAPSPNLRVRSKAHG